MLRTREHRREQPLDEYVPGPIIGHEDRGDPEYEAVLADSAGLARSCTGISPAARWRRA